MEEQVYQMPRIGDMAPDFTANTTATMSENNTSSVLGTNLALSTTLADNGGSTKTLPINASSIASNAGYATGASTVDQRGVTRLGVPDVGSFENTTTTTGKELSVRTITYAQNNGKSTFSNVGNFNQVRIFNSVGQLIKSESITGNSFEFKKGIIVTMPLSVCAGASDLCPI